MRCLQVYKDLDLPESEQGTSRRSLTPRAETNGTAHGDSPTNGRAEADPVVLGCHLVDFWTNICLCQSLIVEEAEDDGPPIYQVWHTATAFFSGRGASYM